MQDVQRNELFSGLHGERDPFLILQVQLCSGILYPEKLSS